MSSNNLLGDGGSTTHSGSETQTEGPLNLEVRKMKGVISRNIKRGSDLVSDALHIVEPWTVDESNEWKQKIYTSSMEMVNEHLDPNMDMPTLIKGEHAAKIKIYDQWMKEVEDRENLTSKEQANIFKKMREAHSFLFNSSTTNSSNSSSEEHIELENVPITHENGEIGLGVDLEPHLQPE
eukprot:TRINITY_DN7808_c0_g1_i2.p1 TRINITY_DN7808_c0_g1~~TRINITY_DN7808_c0_g1_i2.p1  ORF type:complete len:180 (+),score=37.71 TRINITY_DN7808_c0_g1_i2:185-724(+)